ncbi:hypothetical protein ACJ41O_011161 [Fusarium nematophilum]
MKSAILSLLAGSVAAQITIAPELMQFGAVDENDADFTSCALAQNYLENCVSSVGGVEAVSTANPEEFVGCICCAARRPISTIYSACSEYLEGEAPSFSSQYSAFGGLYSICAMSAECSNNAAGNPPAETSVTVIEEPSSITDSPSAQTYASACEDMVGLFTSCTKKNPDFTDLPFREQAACYCCRGQGSDLTWTDEFDSLASTCADWAVTGDPDTLYEVARTFSTFCDNFSDACEGGSSPTTDAETSETEDAESTTESDDEPTSTADDVSAQTEAATSEERQSQDPVTVTVQPTATETSDNTNAAPAVRVGCGAMLAAVAALAIAL